jgi:hypothetical protein
VSKDLIVADYHELLVLHRALMEAKFSQNPWDDVVMGSPLIASLMHRVIGILIEHQQEKGDAQAVRKWQKWLAIDPSRREWVIAKRQAKESEAWVQWSIDEKKQFARILLSPFMADDSLLTTFIKEVDASANPMENS